MSKQHVAEIKSNLQCMLAEKKGRGGGRGLLVGLQDYSVLQASKLKHLDKRVCNFLKIFISSCLIKVVISRVEFKKCDRARENVP